MKITQHFTRAGLESAARGVQIELAMLMAFAEIESPRGPFYADGFPSILFERHVFHRNSGGRWSKKLPLLSSETPFPPGGYGSFDDQRDKLARARQLDEAAAIKACSWGMFQILGENHKAAGYANLQAMEKAMFSLSGQLGAFVEFVKSKPALSHALRIHDFATAARIYNGKGFKKFGYDAKLAAAYREAKDFVRGWR